ncbi:RNA polymerase recycling motor ATPase HelR [Georgenia sp. Z1491]|uniref:RNA polymerase recycling motor ATPase HelR n=1 Tax=Georgenia sp. Z1491 TaxID=3416707 RepID=UPI003CEDD904
MTTPRMFHLPYHLAAKDDPDLIGPDEEHLAAVAAAVEDRVRHLTHRLERARRAPAGGGQQALERDQEVHRLTARLRMALRFGADLCLGRLVPGDGDEPVYVGRTGLTDRAGRRLLVDWRSPAAERFFAATHADPMGLTARRRYRWSRGRVNDYWDEVFSGELGSRASLDDHSAFLASLGADRSPRMRDVLGTIQADQDAIIRDAADGALVVDGGPGTGKTVVALHRTAYLLHSEPRLGHRRGGVLLVGPNDRYLSYVSDVLPNLGEDGVRACTLRDLVPEGAGAAQEPDPEVARLKSSADVVRAVDAAVGIYEEPPTEPLVVGTPWADLVVSTTDWATAFRSPEVGLPHNEARDQVWDVLVEGLIDQIEEDDEVTPVRVRRALLGNDELAGAFERAWPRLDPSDVVADLWEVPAYLRRCAPWLTDDEVRSLGRAGRWAWTTADLPVLDAARRRIGGPGRSAGDRYAELESEVEREQLDHAVDRILESIDDPDSPVVMLHGQDLRASLDAGITRRTPPVDVLAGPFAHVVVDEAQELTDAEWQMVRARCPSGSLTIVGDRAQARSGFPESWEERLARCGIGNARRATLSVNYRTPSEVMTRAEPVIREVLPDAAVPTSVRSTGVPVRYGTVDELEAVIDQWLEDSADRTDGVACVIGDETFPERPRVASLTPERAKGLEFDLVVLVEPAAWGDGVEGAVDRYVAMTRATQQLVVLTG